MDGHRKPFTPFVPDEEWRAQMKRAKEKYGFSMEDYNQSIRRFHERVNEQRERDRQHNTITQHVRDPELQAELKRAKEKYGFSVKDYNAAVAQAREKANEIRKSKGLAGGPGRADEERVDSPTEDLSSPGLTEDVQMGSPKSSLSAFGAAKVNSPQEHEPQRDIVLPDWYSQIDMRGRRMKETRKNPAKRQVITALSSLKDCLQRAENESSASRFSKLCNELRDHVHKAEFLDVDEYTLRGTHMLDNGLARIFDGKAQFPWDLKADALQLYLRWADKNFSVDLLRGIVKATSNGKSGIRSADRIEASWRGKYSSKFFGQGDLVVGQWWPTQLCTVRDGAHGSAQGGIWGEKGKGAYSIVLSGGHGYNDIDHGDEIWYTGTNSKDSNPTENTYRLIETADEFHEPVRVIRSSNLSKKNVYRPERGFRYDGLYDVVGYVVLDEVKAEYQFHMKRREGQDPIRWEDKPSRRPTKWEMDEYDKLRLISKDVVIFT